MARLHAERVRGVDGALAVQGLYPNVGRALKEAESRGIDVPVMLGPDGKVCEFATSNLFFVRDGVAVTPAPNGCFLAGIPRRRSLELLEQAGIPVEQREVDYDELLAADEIFSTGNYGKVLPVRRRARHVAMPGHVQPLHRRTTTLQAPPHDDR